MSEGKEAVAKRIARNSSVDAVLDVLRAHGPSSQAALARRTGLSRATVNNVVKKLHGKGVVSLDWINGKEALVTLGFGGGTIASVIVAPQRVKVRLYRFDKQSCASLDWACEPSAHAQDVSPAAVVEALGALGEREGIRIAELSAVALAIQAPIERESGAIVPWSASRFPLLKGLRLDRVFGELLKVPVVVDNDANLAALAEWTWGTGRGTDDFLYILSSEGVGGGLVLGGKIYRGGTGVAGELGHMILEESGPLCFCGGRGCLHALISEKAILASLEESVMAKASLEEVIRSALGDDAACQRVLFEAGRRLGRAIANAARVVGPSAIAIGGTLSGAGSLILSGLESSPEMSNLHSLSSATKVHVATVREAVALGGVAAALALLDRGISSLPAWMEAQAP